MEGFPLACLLELDSLIMAAEVREIEGLLARHGGEYLQS